MAHILIVVPGRPSAPSARSSLD